MATTKELENVYLSEGLQGFDEKLDKLLEIWETRLQLSTIEASSPDLDLFTFSQTVPFFAVIMLGTSSAPQNKVQLTVMTTSSALRLASLQVVGLEPPPLRRKLLELRMDDDDDFPSPPRSSNSGRSQDTDSLDDPPLPRTSWVSQQQPQRASSSSYFACTEPWIPAYEQHPAFDRAAKDKILGLSYLSYSHGLNGVTTREVDVGIALDAGLEGQGYAQKAMELVLKHAFETMNVHRVQALLIDQWSKHGALSLFNRMKFVHEGTRRLSFLSPIEHEWKDTVTMSLLETDWVLRTSRRAPTTLWDEMLQRHAAQRSELLRWEERRSRFCLETTEDPMESLTPTGPLTPIQVPNSLFPWSDGEPCDREKSKEESKIGSSPSSSDSDSSGHSNIDKGKERKDNWFDFDNEDFSVEPVVKTGSVMQTLMKKLAASRNDEADRFASPTPSPQSGADWSPSSMSHSSAEALSLPPDSDFENLTSGSEWDMMDEDRDAF